MVRVVIGASRYAFVLVGDARFAAIDAGPVRYALHLWKDGRRVIPSRVVRAASDEFAHRGESEGDFLGSLHAYLPTLPALYDDAAERWLRALVLATEETQTTARMTREGTRRVLRARGSDDSFGGGRSTGVTVIEAWLDDSGAWDVETHVETRIRGSVSLGDGEAISGDGDFSAAEVTAMIRQRLPAIRACYETQLRRDPHFAGRVKVEFTIETTGAVRNVRATENTTNDSAVGACVTGVVSRFRWNPGPEGGSLTFSYPFEFSLLN